MGRSSEEGYRAFRGIASVVTRRHKALLALWILLFVGALAANQVWRSSDVITFYQSATLPEDTESAKAQEIIDAQFPGQTANSSATVVLVAANVTLEPYRPFAIDLHDAIVVASTLADGETRTLRLQTGANLTIDEPIRFLRDPGNATIYAVYESYAYALALQFNDAVHGQVAFTETASGIYWGLPAYFLSVWENATLLGDPDPNGTAYAATQAYYASFPALVFPWTNASFNTFYPAWQASFSNGSMASFLPSLRAETVVGQSLPVFLSSPFAIAAFDGNERLFQLGMLAVFRLTNFADPALIESYALAVFPPIGVADLAFFEDLFRDLPPNATDARLRSFARAEILRYDEDTTPLTPPLDVARFFLSPDRRLLLMNYGFDRDAEYVDASHRKPVAEAVGVIRDLVARVRGEYEASAGFVGAVYVTGSAPLSVDQEFLLGGGAEFGVTILLVIILIGLYFRSAVSPAFPILTIAIAIMISNLFVYLIAVYVLSLHFTVTAVLQTVLLATGTDYSIFLIARFRDERQDGRDKKEAVRNAVLWAGESVATSGGAVLIAFAALSLGSFPIVKGMGITIGFAVTIALGVALTFIPAVLMVLGDRVFWPSGKRVAAVRPKGQRTASERYFHGAADFSMRHAKAIVLVAVLVTIPSVYLVLTDEPSFDLSEGVPPTESSRGLDAISASFGQGFFFPAYVVVQFPGAVRFSDGNVSVPKLDAIATLGARLLAEEPAIKSVEGPTNPQGSPVDYRNLSAMPAAQRSAILAAMSPYIGTDNRTVRVLAVLVDPPFSRDAIHAIDRISATLADIRADDPELRAATVYLGGVSAVLNDVRDTTNRDLQVMAVIVVIGLFLVLLFVLGSVLIPLRAVLTILLSIGWTLALTIVLFQVWKGLDVIFVLPLAMFVMAMGLGMDYDIFIITRVREEVAKGKTDREAILEAVTRTGGIISACGIVMAGAFATLMISPLPFLQEIGFALAAVILIDSTVVRIYLVPAIMVLAGKYNWWAPGRLQRVRREEPADARKV